MGQTEGDRPMFITVDKFVGGLARSVAIEHNQLVAGGWGSRLVYQFIRFFAYSVPPKQRGQDA